MEKTPHYVTREYLNIRDKFSISYDEVDGSNYWEFESNDVRFVISDNANPHAWLEALSAEDKSLSPGTVVARMDFLPFQGHPRDKFRYKTFVLGKAIAGIGAFLRAIENKDIKIEKPLPQPEYIYVWTDDEKVAGAAGNLGLEVMGEDCYGYLLKTEFNKFRSEFIKRSGKNITKLAVRAMREEIKILQNK